MRSVESFDAVLELKMCPPQLSRQSLGSTQYSFLKESSMKWYHYLICFFAGLFLANSVPHLIHGISGDSFPSPFSTPPGKGLSSPSVNVLWGLGNLLVGYILLRVGKFSQSNIGSLITLFVGVVCMSIMLSIAFVDKMH
jgi:hypothetical protein